MNKLVLGTVQFGLDYGINNQSGQVPLKEVTQILAYCKTNGLLKLDTAAAYGNTESILSEAHPALEEDFQIISKLRIGVTPDEFEAELNQSLTRLSSKRLYGLLFHDFNDFQKSPEAFMEKISKAKAAGQILKIGFSIYSENQLEWLLEQSYPVDLVQTPFSLYDKRFEPYFEPLKKRFQTEIHVRSVFLQGLYFMNPEELPTHLQVFKEPLLALRQFADAHNSTVATIALTVPALHQNIDGVLVGVDSLHQLQQNVKAYSESDQEFLNYPFEPIDLYYLNPSNWKQKSK